MARPATDSRAALESQAGVEPILPTRLHRVQMGRDDEFLALFYSGVAVGSVPRCGAESVLFEGVLPMLHGWGEADGGRGI